MHTPTTTPQSLDRDALRRATRTEADRLRRQAIDDTLDAAGAQAARALRAANRLAHALARHARLRQGPPVHG